MPTFDGDNLIITLDAVVGGALTVDVEVDLYSAWKEWFKTGTNSKYPLAFRVDGGAPLTTGIKQGAYFFIQNDLGWRIRPFENDGTYYIVGNLAPEVSSIPILIGTIGPYTVLVDGLQPITQNVDSIIEEQAINVEQLRFRIESIRQRSPGTGSIIYYDPINGDDSNDGSRFSKSVKTFARAHDLVSDGRHDVIQIVDTSNLNVINVDEPGWVVTKSDVSVRGPGWDLVIYPTQTTDPTIKILGDECVLENFQVRGADTGSQNAVVVDADLCTLSNMKLKRSRNICLEIRSSGCLVENSIIEHNTVGLGIGVSITADAHETEIRGSNIYDMVTGIDVSGTAHGNFIRSTSIHDGTNAIVTNAGTMDLHIFEDCMISGVVNRIVDGGTNTHDQYLTKIGNKLTDIHDEAFGKWTLDPIAKTLTLYRADGVAILKQFNLTDTLSSVPNFIGRTPA